MRCDSGRGRAHGMRDDIGQAAGERQYYFLMMTTVIITFQYPYMGVYAFPTCLSTNRSQIDLNIYIHL